VTTSGKGETRLGASCSLVAVRVQRSRAVEVPESLDERADEMLGTLIAHGHL
jgi:hypothetical protein